ncbi:VanZ family protein [Intestinimonas massiliensis]|jgi:glycopeptide antibiotics resistance protein|uniref:VanZ family protein n=1 Tax=Intestinimonas massiliensis (ex Afouda et al. 2020) TaxID=1673721 RepID=A0ABS9MEP8_9FIRM|nr:VanZ family protein [Intestinimonas massiliensis (ex Afouda et al. 2020)]MCG4529290.1 VanZ family protein [Intestinimonas massiliensis (ex Afouda et al. 2020)]MCQ4808127.1 VanZ family protein [Intestinimonas massiliensis (ex Afouda et al. 2020)]
MAENAGNILMFLPFGALYPLFHRNSTWIHTILMGIGVSVGIELLQPIFGRSFDINDIILNGFGVIVSTGIFFLGNTAQ